MPEDDRAVSEVLGYSLVFSLVLVTVAMVTVGGLGQLSDARNAEQLNNAERAFDLLAANIDDVAKRGAPSRSTEISLRDAGVDIANPVTFEFRAIDDEDDSNNFTESYQVWPVRYRSNSDASAVVYSGGAVLRSDRESGVTLRRSDIVANGDDEIVVPLVLTRSRNAQNLGEGTIRVRAKHATTDVLVSDKTDMYETFFTNVTSPRADVWATELDTLEGFSCSVDESGSVDQAECEADPARLHVALIKVDLELAD